MTTFHDHFDLERELGGLWLPGERRPDYFPGHEDYADDHQLEMWDAIHGDAEVVVNSNPTGSGKTRSWAVPTFRSGENGDGWIVIATYPTNALLEDQKSTLRTRLEEYYRSNHEEVPDVTVSENEDGVVFDRDGNREQLSDLIRPVSGGTTLGQSTGDAFHDALEDAAEASRAGFPVVILTTPDVVNSLGAGLYWNPDANVAPGLVDMIVVDEFHLANPRGKRLLPFYLDLYMRIPNGYLDTLIFLSATPDEAYVDRLRNAFDVRVVGRDSATTPIDDECRQILPEGRLLVRSGSSIFKNGSWLVNRASDILEWHDDEGKLLVIVDSVREVEDVAEALDEVGSYDVGKVYGWKKRGRERVIEESDVIVGNTAMEVGVDFDRVSRVVCTAYDASSAIQRIGRMRASDELDDQAIALLTTQGAHQAIMDVGAAKRVERRQLASALDSELDPIQVAPYYDSLCCTFSRYLWEQSLGNWIHSDDAPIYKRAVADHFGGEDGPETVWSNAGKLLERYRSLGKVALFEEMLTFRPSSLTVIVLDITDWEEPVKTANLRSVCRNRHGTFVDTLDDLFDRYRSEFESVAEADRRLAEDADRYSCGYFVSTGSREKSGEFSLRQFSYVERWRKESNESPMRQAPELLPDPTVNVSPDLAPGRDTLDLGDEVLAQYVEECVDDTRNRYRLGPYADLLALDEKDSLALWQDAILVHSQKMSDKHMETAEQ